MASHWSLLGFGASSAHFGGSVWGPFGVHLGSIWGPSSIHLGVHAWGSVRRPFLLLFTALGGCQGRFARAWRAWDPFLLLFVRVWVPPENKAIRFFGGKMSILGRTSHQTVWRIQYTGYKGCKSKIQDQKILGQWILDTCPGLSAWWPLLLRRRGRRIRKLGGGWKPCVFY